MNVRILAITLVVGIAGCSSCQQSESAQPRPASQAPGSSDTAEVAPEVAATAAAESDEDVGEEDDCFVILDASPDYGDAPLDVQFNADVDCSSGEPKYEWDFGDGSPITNDVSPLHRYEKAGEYTASVRVVGPGGGKDVDEIDILVEE